MNKIFKIDYFTRDYATIKDKLISNAQRYYPEIGSNLSETNINSFLIDSVAYVGDVLSYYLDFQTNESFLATALDANNINLLAKSLGYKTSPTFSTVGKVAFFMLIPSDNFNQPDYSKAPIIKKDTALTSARNKLFLVAEDIVIDANLVGSNYTVARTNSVGNPTFYAVKFYVPVVSGVLSTATITVGAFQKFQKVQIPDTNIVEIVSVQDSEGNEYYEVENLAQNIVYKNFFSSDTSNSTVKAFLKPIVAQRRFVFDNDLSEPTLIFGANTEASSLDLSVNPVAEPNKFAIEKYNSEYLNQSYFDPNKLLNGDNFGIAPSNTVLRVRYRKNTSADNNVAIGDLQTIRDLVYEFPTSTNITSDTRDVILNSIQVINDEPILGDSLTLTSQEVKQVSGMVFQSQNRAVTAKDYESLVYKMPSKLGSIKRCKASRDEKSLKNNINLYVISVDTFNNLTQCNTKIKENLKKWLLDYKIITDTIDILDTKIINFKIEFTALIDPRLNKNEIRLNCINQLSNYFSIKPQIGEPLSKLDILRQLRNVNGVLDLKDLKVSNLNGGFYSTTYFNVESNETDDGNMIIIPKNAIYEIKNLDTDIVGNVI